MKFPHKTAVELTAASLALALTIAGCGSKDEEPTAKSSESSSAAASATSSAPEAPAAPADYSVLLMDAGDIPIPAGEFIGDPPVLNPSGIEGVAQLFHNADNTAMIGDTIAVLGSPEEAAGVLNNMMQTQGAAVTGTPQASPVGTNGTVTAGTSPDGSKAVTSLMFTEANTVVNLQFDSAPGDLNPVPPDFVETVGTLQLDAVKAGLPELPPPGTPPR